jgi:hypothetical protein
MVRQCSFFLRKVAFVDNRDRWRCDGFAVLLFESVIYLTWRFPTVPGRNPTMAQRSTPLILTTHSGKVRHDMPTKSKELLAALHYIRLFQA